jgi:P-type E1-E2 ATPase
VTRLQDAGATVVLVEHDGILLGAVAVRDDVRPEAAEAVAQLKRQSVAVVMLTGDNARTADAIAADAGITDVRAGLLPADKARIVTVQVRGPVAMVGDGSNDAPALATAEVGIAMGSDVAMFALAVRQRDRREAVGQVIRIIVAAPGSAPGSALGRYPEGNTGRATVELTQPMPIPQDLALLLQATN